MDPRYHPTSWEQPHPTYPQLTGKVTADVIVIGAGITGLTAALYLKREGKRVVLLESQFVGSGTTGGTSAHLSTLYDQTYHRIKSSYDAASSELVASSLQRGLDIVTKLAQELAIDCELKAVPAYLYTENPDKSAVVTAECEAAAAAGIVVAMADTVPLPFPVITGFRAEGQAQIHPIKYLQGLAAAVDGGGCALYEHSGVIDLKETDGACHVTTPQGEAVAPAVVMATHTPIGINIVQTQLSAMRSYILAFTSPQRLPDALFYDCADPYHYIRSSETTEGRVLIVGGADRRVGHGDEEESFKELEAYVSRRFKINQIVWRWSAQFYEPADLLPFIGPLPGTKRQYMGAGYAGDGLVLGSCAGWMLAEQVCQRATVYDDLYHPGRLRRQGVHDIVALGVDGISHAVGDRMPHFEGKKLQDLAPGEGGIVQVGLRKVAAYRDASGVLRTFSATCPHMQAIVHWNSEHQTFDCPWHGSRFDKCGHVLEGPSTAPLAAFDHRHGKQPEPMTRVEAERRPHAES